MGQVRVRRSRLSPLASVMMVLVGALAFLYVNSYAGLILMILGVVMYAFYRRVSKHPRPSGRTSEGEQK